MQTLIAALLAALACLSMQPAWAAPKASDLVRAELVAEPKAVVAGVPFTVAVRLSMAEHWHTYWQNPGDSGLATTVAWTLPQGFSAGPIQWPTPNRIAVSHLMNFGYEGEATLLVEITPPATLPAGRPVSLNALVSYLVCERECIPGEATLKMELPVVAGAVDAGPDGSVSYVFAAARASQPTRLAGTARLVQTGPEGLQLDIDAADLVRRPPASAFFFPFDDTLIEHAAPQVLATTASGVTLALRQSSIATQTPLIAAGVLVIESERDGQVSRVSYQVGSPSLTPPAASTAPAAVIQPAAGPRADLSFAAVAQAAILAFIGGLILNLMPCVFPILSVKVLSLVKYSGQSRSEIRLGGVFYTAGVVLSFAALAGALIAIRAGGAEIGWGFQLQSPLVVATLALLLFAMGLGLSGVIEIGSGLAGRVGALASRGDGRWGSLLSGVLAAAVAAPCTAPFMGAAVGYALTAPAPIAMTVFVALGLGMAAPFLIFTVLPGLLSGLPRPGPWMETLKQVLAFPVYATVAWLVFVLSQQVGPTGLFAALLGLVAIAFAFWSWQLGDRQDGWGRGLARGVAVAALLALVPVGLAVQGDVVRGDNAGTAPAGGVERFSQARLDALRAEGRTVFVNMTAAWCITCIVNERTVLTTNAVKARFDQVDISYLKGDWTNQNPEITRLLERHGRSGVPLYVLYPGKGDPVVLPEILTQAIVLDSLSGLPSATKRADMSKPTRSYP